MLNEYIINQVVDLFDKKLDLSMLNPLGAEPEIVSIGVDMYPIIRIGDKKEFIFIPTGTKDNPKGLTNTKYKFCLILDDKSSNYIIISTVNLKNFIKKNIVLFERSLGYDFETFGFKMDFNKFITLLKNEVPELLFNKVEV